jgi:hypothetical protein
VRSIVRRSTDMVSLVGDVVLAVGLGYRGWGMVSLVGDMVLAVGLGYRGLGTEVGVLWISFISRKSVNINVYEQVKGANTTLGRDTC